MVVEMSGKGLQNMWVEVATHIFSEHPKEGRCACAGVSTCDCEFA